MLTVVETPTFVRSVAGLWTEAEHRQFVDFIAQYPTAGDVVPGTKSLRKLRWTRAGLGKRGGVRVIYFQRLDSGEVLLLIAYAKAKFDNLPKEFLNRLKENYDV